MDLEPLKIDRSKQKQARRRSGGAGGGWGKWVFLGLIAVGLWLFRARLTELVDGLRLPRVDVIRVTKSSPLAASAVTGTAANGYIVASKRAALSADTPGRIVEMNVVEGSLVREGDVVARLYSDEYRAELQRTVAELASGRVAVKRSEADSDVEEGEIERLRSEAEAALARKAEAVAGFDLAEKELVRSRRLVEEGVESQRDLDAAEAERERAEAAVHSADAAADAAAEAVNAADLRWKAATASVEEAQSRIAVLESARDQAQATLDKTEVRAPFDGIVVLKDAEVGEVVSPNSQGGNSRGSVCTMVDLASLEVQVDLPETSLSAVEVGGTAKIFLDAFPARPYRGRVERIWPTANRQKATVEIRVGFAQPDELLRPEMGARVVFGDPEAPVEAESDTSAPEHVLIPTECVVRVDGRSGVFLLERDVARFQEVRLGEERSGRILVESGLEGGERIVARPPNSLTDGDRVLFKEGT